MLQHEDGIGPRKFGEGPISPLRLAVVQGMRQGSGVDIDLDNLTPEEQATWEKERDAVLLIEKLTGRARKEAEKLVLHQLDDPYYGFGVDHPPSYAILVGEAYAKIDKLTGQQKIDAEEALNLGRMPDVALNFVQNNEKDGLYNRQA